MSFSTTTKSELARLGLDKRCCKSVAFGTFLECSGSLHAAGPREIIVFSSENAAIARKFYKLSKELLGCKPVISVSRRNNFNRNNLYSVRIPINQHVREGLVALGISLAVTDMNYIMNSERRMPVCCEKIFLRCSFLASGSMINPQRTYHLEITCSRQENAKKIAEIMTNFGLKPGIIRRKQWHVVYLKEADQIADFLNVVGAHTALLNLESIRTIKGMRNKVNRLINCETANINKSINASLNQIDNINTIRRTIGLGRLPESLSTIAALRLENPDASLKELGEMMEPPVGKSGVNHRMRKIEQIADKLKGRK